MAFFKRRNNRRKSSGNNVYKAPVKNAPPPEPLPSAPTSLPMQKETVAPLYFGNHIAKYLGQTITVFVAAGGVLGSGFTGILLDANPSYIRLITSIGPAPAPPWENSYIYPFSPNPFGVFNKVKYWGFINTLGSITCIPVNKIVSFIHNTI